MWRGVIVGIAAIVLMTTVTPLNAEEVRIKHAGLTLNGVLTIAEGKAPDAGVVMIVHGTLAHNTMDTISNLNDVLVERGLNTLAINLSLGIDDRHGMYDCQTLHRHRHLDALDEIDAWLAWLKKRNFGPVTLLGHSRGGNQVARFAAERPHSMIERLVLMAPATWNADGAAKGFEKRHGRPLAGVLKKASTFIEAGQGHKVMAKTGLLYCKGADVTAASFQSYYRPHPRFDTPTILAEISVPTLVVAAGKDAVVRGLPERVAPLTKPGKIELSVVDDADHFFLDLFAEDVADAIEEFLSAGI